MENFVLYDEIGRGEKTVVYKGRRKGTISFLAIHCIEKSKRPYITNRVRLTHELHHKNIVEFYEWYETSNHLWLVVELCTGGSLETVLVQDGHLPESSIREFGVDMVKGLHHLHSLGIVFADLTPAKLLLDGPGVLKFSNFELARAECENLDELFHSFIDQEQDQDEKPNFDTCGKASYMAPELTKGGVPSFSSDLWSVGVVLYELYTGHTPFESDTYQQLMSKIQTQAYPPPKVKGARLSTKPSPEFLSLIEGLLKKDPKTRLGWSALVAHPFWQGKLSCLAKDIQASIDPGKRESIVRESLVLTKSEAEPVQNLDSNVLGQSVQLSQTSVRPRTTPEKGEGNATFQMSRPSTAGQVEEIPAKPATGSLPAKPASEANVNDQLERQTSNDEVPPVATLLYHQSDVLVSSIVDNPKILKPAPLKYDSKIIPVPPYSMDKLASMSPADVQKHVQQVCDVISSPEKGPPSQKRLHLINYACTVASKAECANHFVQCGILIVLVRHLKEQSVPELRQRLARLIGIIANNVTVLDEGSNINEVLTLLCEVVRDGYRVVRTKLALLPALGELLFMVACQEEIKGYAVDNWSAPSMTFTLILRALRDQDDGVVNHYAAKIVENVSTTNSQNAQKFVTNEVGQALWFIFTHAKTDAARVTSIMALNLICKQNAAVFQSIVDKSGLSAVLTAMNTSLNKIQQAFATMFTQLIISGTLVQRFVTDKDFVTQTMKLLDSSSPVVRAKTFLLIHQILLVSEDLLLTFCQARLVMYMERDIRRQTPKPSDNGSNENEYLTKCLQLLQDYIVGVLPKITLDIITTLESVTGRKHPSSAQSKQIKQVMPMMPVFLHILTSQLFRPRVVDDKFVEQMATFLKYVKAVDSGDINLDSSIGAGSTDSFVQTVFSMIESVAQHPNILVQYEGPVMDHIIPVLANLLSCRNGDARVLSFKLLTDISSTLLAGETYVNQTDMSRKLQDTIGRLLLDNYEQILFDQDPMPGYGLKLLFSLLEQNQVFVRKFQTAGLTPALFQVLVDHQPTPLGSVVQTIVQILTNLVNCKETNMNELYDCNLVDNMSALFVSVSQLCLSEDERIDSKAACKVMSLIIELLHDIFKYLSEVVKKALQAKKAGADGGTMEADKAEKLLLANKPFTDLTSNLAQLMCYEDAEVADEALKCLSLMVQLFGGESPSAMTTENMDCYNQALQSADARRQKILLRIIKRYLSTEPSHVNSLRKEGGELLQTIRGVADSASTVADVAVSSLATDILKMTGN